MNSHETMQSTEELALLRAELERVHLHNIELSRQQFHFQQLFANGQFQPQASPTASVVQFPNIATNYNPNYRNIFLSGALNADDWQKYIIDKLRPFPVCVFNPRREGDTQKHGGGEVGNQQAWEMEAIERCNCVVFWFPWDHPNITICLLQLGKELGKWAMSRKAIFIGIHPKNKDRKIILDFVKTAAPAAYVGSNLDKLVQHLINWVHTGVMPANSQTSSSGESSIEIQDQQQQQRPAEDKKQKKDKEKKSKARK